MKSDKRKRARRKVTPVVVPSFEHGTPVLNFHCEHGVYRRGGQAAICYTTDEARARLIVKALNFYFRHNARHQARAERVALNAVVGGCDTEGKR